MDKIEIINQFYERMEVGRGERIKADQEAIDRANCAYLLNYFKNGYVDTRCEARARMTIEHLEGKWTSQSTRKN